MHSHWKLGPCHFLVWNQKVGRRADNERTMFAATVPSWSASDLAPQPSALATSTTALPTVAPLPEMGGPSSAGAAALGGGFFLRAEAASDLKRASISVSDSSSSSSSLSSSSSTSSAAASSSSSLRLVD